MRVIRQQFLIDRRLRQSDGIPVAMSINTPSVEHDEDNVFILHQISSKKRALNS
jgi:hypothetical protein